MPAPSFGAPSAALSKRSSRDPWITSFRLQQLHDMLGQALLAQHHAELGLAGSVGDRLSSSPLRLFRVSFRRTPWAASVVSPLPAVPRPPVPPYDARWRSRTSISTASRWRSAAKPSGLPDCGLSQPLHIARRTPRFPCRPFSSCLAHPFRRLVAAGGVEPPFPACGAGALPLGEAALVAGDGIEPPLRPYGSRQTTRPGHPLYGGFRVRSFGFRVVNTEPWTRNSEPSVWRGPWESNPVLLVFSQAQ